MSQPVHIFWDNSNIFIAAKHIATQKEGGFAEQNVRINFENLYHVAHAGRTVASALAVGSIPPEMELVWTRLRQIGVNVELFERGAHSNKEQAVDQSLQVHMLRTLFDIKEPAVAVLLTGDGRGYDEGVGFHADLERMWKAGWGIEVVSWDHACNPQLRSWAENNGVYVKLEDYYESVTYIQSGRSSKAPSLKARKTAAPRKAGA